MTNTISYSKKTGILKKLSAQIVATICILFGMVLIIGIINPVFFKWENLNMILQQVSSTGVVALGAMFVLITGGIDLSTGTGLAMCAVFAGVLYFNVGQNLLVLILCSILAGIILGFVNGVLVTKLKLQPFIATLGVMSIAQGVALLISEGKVVFINTPGTMLIGRGQIFGIFPYPFAIFLFMCLISYIILNYTKLGTYTFAIGGNEEAAKFSGININKYKLLVYIFAGICTGIGALLAVSRIGQIAPNLGGTTLLDAIAATVIGGTSVSGGKGSVFGTILGVLIIGIASNALTFLHIQPTAQNVVKGFIIMLVLIIDALLNRKKA